MTVQVAERIAQHTAYGPRIVSNHYTRTYYQSDSFVANIRRELPREIDADFFETHLSDRIGADELIVLQRLYAQGAGRNGPAYLLRGLPLQLNAAEANGMLAKLQSNPETQELLRSIYSLQSPADHYWLSDSLNEEQELQILRALKLFELYSSAAERALVSEILCRSGARFPVDRFYASLFIPEDHGFFAPPNLKHISGMHITEAARQFGIACHHVFGNVPVEGVTFLLDSLSSQFLQYARINLPIKLIAEPATLKVDKDGMWRAILMHFSAYQDGQEISRVQASSTILPLKLYRRLKSQQSEDSDRSMRFALPPNLQRKICIHYQDNEQEHEWQSALLDFSQGGFSARGAAKDQPPAGDAQPLDFIMQFENIGFVHGRCRCAWSSEDGSASDQRRAGFEILEISQNSSENLAEAIRRYGRLIERRQIV
ncbi:MAG: hypothetical protein K1X75_06260 [Leptospirales bacterium]|nr:hypothetical protein [Leptospirales bacterium]